MPSLKKLLSKLSREERKAVEIIIESIVSLDWEQLDIKKLKGHQNVFRVRKGNLRIIFLKKEKDIFIVAIDRRNEKTYKL